MDADDVGGLGHISGDRDDAAARIAAGCATLNGFGRRLQRFRAAGRDHDVGAGRHELRSDCKTKPLAAAGYNCRTAVKRYFHGGFL
jgi:hypothetical protein